MTEIWKFHATKLGEEFAKEQKITSLPVDPIEIAENLDILVEPLPADKRGVSGMLMENNNNFGIKYATYVDNIGFQHFCVAHELGHYSIPGHYEQLMESGFHESSAGFVSNEKYELEADHFAAGLLMPSFLFDAELNKHQSGLNPEALNDALTAIISLAGLIIEICGAWVWVTGDTYKHKAILKDNGFKYASKKKAWHFRPENWKSSSRGQASMDEIRGKYGSTSPVMKGRNCLIDRRM